MRKLIGIFIAVLLAGLLPSPLLADGIIIIDPPPLPQPEPLPWLTIRYHHVQVTLEEQVAVTRVDQVFRNDNRFDVEGTYLFPLPPGAVVQRFVMWADGVPMEAKILPAAEARTIYEEYVRRQQDPALLEYVGRDAVQARIFPIPAGAERRIELEYTQALAAENGLLHYRYPLNTERFSAQPLEQLYISVEIRSQTPLRALYSPSHQEQLLIQREGDTHATVSYEAQHVYPDRDFELFIGLEEDPIGANLLTYRQGTEDGFFLLMLTPAFDLDAAHILPKDVLLVLDTSGSMEGEKLQQAKDALRYVLRHLNAEDRFNVIAFSSGVRSYAPALRPPAEAEAAIQWVADLEALGGTNIYLALSEALRQAQGERPTALLFLTDGLPTEGLTDEGALLAALQQEAPAAVRIFPFGVGYDVNTVLLEQLAETHKGRSTYVEPDERLDEVFSTFYSRIQSPVLTDISLDFGDARVYELYPQPLPDLFAGTQLLVAGRYAGSGPQQITLTGQVAGQQRTATYNVVFAESGGQDFIPRLWAARRIGYLLTQIRLNGEQQEWVDAVVTLSLRYGIITPYTSFLVDENVLTTEGRQQATEDLLAASPQEAYGEQAVEDAKVRLGLGGAEAPPPAAAEVPEAENGAGETATTTVRYVNHKTFLCREGACTDTAFIPDQMTPLTVRFDSETYWQLVRERPAWSGYLALGTQVTFVAEDGVAYRVQAGDDVIEDPLPQGPSAPSASAPLPAPETTPTPLPAAIARQAQEQQLCGGAIVLMLLVLGAALLLRH
ncbi:MAG TPA: VIT domain-containing protein [Anaerolineae bacterium]|nr:VIT domain-containing protein [Anaerolineae bacterium]